MTIVINAEWDFSSGKRKALVEARRDQELIHYNRMNLESAFSRKQFANDLVGKLNNGVKVADVETLLIEQLSKLLNTPAPEAPPKPTAAALLEGMPEDIQADAISKLQDPELIDEIRADCRAIGIAGDTTVGLAVYCIGVSRLLDRPMAGIVRGASASGKSYIIGQVAQLFPPETKLEAHYLTPKALYYLPDDALVHRFVVAGERPRSQDDDQADATKALREMISDGVLRCITVEQIDGKLQTVECVKPGPIAYVESTTASRIFEEDLNRCIILPVDESPEQTAIVIKATGQAAADAANGDITSRIILTHHAMQRMLQPYKITIPYAPFIAERFRTDKVEGRRMMPHLLNAIRAACLLRQFQKRPADGVLQADVGDYRIALELVKPTLRRLNDSADANVIRILDAVRKHVVGDDEFTRAQAAGWAGVQQGDCNGRIRILAERGWINETVEGRGNRPAKFKLTDLEPDADDADDLAGLPTPDEIRDRGGVK